MMIKQSGCEGELYGIYYMVYGSLAGSGQLVKAYFWEGPYTDLKTALQRAESLRIAYQNDECFVLKKYKESQESK